MSVERSFGAGSDVPVRNVDCERARSAGIDVGAKIDVHQHVLPPDYVEALNIAGLSRAGGTSVPAWRPSSAIESMDWRAIGVGVLSVSSPGFHPGDDAAARDFGAALQRIFGARAASAEGVAKFAGFDAEDQGALAMAMRSDCSIGSPRARADVASPR